MGDHKHKKKWTADQRKALADCVKQFDKSNVLDEIKEKEMNARAGSWIEREGGRERKDGCAGKSPRLGQPNKKSRALAGSKL